MALVIGDVNANSGMSKQIFDQLDTNLMTPEEKGQLNPEDLETLRNSWRKLAYSIAKGVIEHIVSNLEISGIQTKGNVNASMKGNTGFSDPGNHRHSVSLSGVQNNVVFTQSNDGTGLVE